MNIKIVLVLLLCAGSTFVHSQQRNDNIQESVINQSPKKSNLYGGSSDAALAATKYISTGHYQEINSTILTAIKQVGGEYIFNGIEIFGGDSYSGVAGGPDRRDFFSGLVGDFFTGPASEDSLMTSLFSNTSDSTAAAG